MKQRWVITKGCLCFWIYAMVHPELIGRLIRRRLTSLDHPEDLDEVVRNQVFL